jgi:polyhydroxybutyrate depolymerase
MSRFLSIALLLSLACHSRAPAGGGASDGPRTMHDLMIQGKKRSYCLHRPALPEGEKVPLMIVLHGGLGNAETVEENTGMSAVADRGRFIVAYPEGTGGRLRKMEDRRTWNAGRCCGQAVRSGADDVAFISAMIDDIAEREPVDLNRVYVTGMSNGAMMAYRLACEIPEKLAAIIPVAGTLAVDDCGSAKEVPVLHIHCDEDTHVPIEGGRGEDSATRVEHRSVPETMRLITAARRCSGSKTETLSDSVERTTYHCADGGPVQLLIIKGCGHVWPGGGRQAEQEGASSSFSASRTAWDFARQFAKKR